MCIPKGRSLQDQRNGAVKMVTGAMNRPQLRGQWVPWCRHGTEGRGEEGREQDSS